MDPSSFLIGALIVTAKGFAIGALGFGIAWWRARDRIRELEAQQRLDPEPLHERLDRLESSLDSMAGALERVSAGQSELQRRLAPPQASVEATRPPNAAS